VFDLKPVLSGFLPRGGVVEPAWATELMGGDWGEGTDGPDGLCRLPGGTAQVAVVVDDYDRALDFYVGVLGFRLVEDTDLGGGKRWVVVRPHTPLGASLLLARADGPEQAARVGDQTGGRVGFFVHVADCEAEHRRLVAAGVRFEESPRRESYGTVAVFLDVFGNRWDLIGPPTP
jgi:catechol 2,3-dioxygenase-like lactoylglutathione lyase family enzyme